MKRLGLMGALLLAIVVALGTGILVLGGTAQPEQVVCAPGASLDVIAGDLPDEVAGYSGQQLENAATIMRVGADKGLDGWGQALGVMTAMGESTLLVLDRGDAVGPDSRGLFQQRANGAWGTYADQMDPARSAAMFFDALLAVEGWRELEPTIAANQVQHNADPLHYASYWPAAGQVARALSQQGASISAAAETSKYELGEVKPHTQALAEEVGQRFSVDQIGGQRDAAVDQGGHPAGLALDFMTGRDRSGGEQIASYLLEHAGRLSVDYVIWRQAIWRAAEPDAGWQPMEDRGSATANHLDHVHVNLTPTPSTTGEGGAGMLDCIAASAPASGQPAGSGTWFVPVDGPITSGYGPRWGSFHGGTDLGAPCGTPIYAATDGLVTFAGPGPHPRYGITGHVIVLDHGGGLETTYNHMFAWGVGVRPGQRVTAGQQIGQVGTDGNSTGCHLHLGVYQDGQHTDAAPFMAERAVPLG